MKLARFDHVASTRLLIGLWIIILGGVLLLANLGVIEVRQFFRYFWPLIFMFIGTTMVMNQSNPRRRRLGWVFILIGAWILIHRIGWIDISIFKLLLPGVLIFVGGTLVWRAFAAPHGNKLTDAKPGRFFEPPPAASSDAKPVLTQAPTEEPLAEFMRYFAVMSSNELRPVSRPFRGADLSAVMAGITLNLLDARMESDSANIEVFAFWGGMEIYVPSDWTVVSKVTTLLGGFIDKRRPTTVAPTKTLVISGLVLMGGIEIKS